MLTTVLLSLMSAGEASVQSDFPLVPTILLLLLIFGPIAFVLFSVRHVRRKREQRRREARIAEFNAIQTSHVILAEGDTHQDRLKSIKQQVKDRFFPAQ
jgi:hypothetical protein